MVSLKTLLEKLGKDATAGDYVKDFKKSDAPQFKGKSDKKKQKMAIAAYLDAKDSEKNERISTVDVDQKKRDLKVARIDKKIKDLKKDEDVNEISAKMLNRYYNKAKTSHDQSKNSAFARHLRKEPGVDKDLAVADRRKKGIKLAKNRAIRRLRGEIK